MQFRLFDHFCFSNERHLDGLTQGKWMYFFFTKPDIETPSRLMPRTFLTNLIKAAQ